MARLCQGVRGGCRVAPRGMSSPHKSGATPNSARAPSPALRPVLACGPGGAESRGKGDERLTSVRTSNSTEERRCLPARPRHAAIGDRSEALGWMRGVWEGMRLEGRSHSFGETRAGWRAGTGRGGGLVIMITVSRLQARAGRQTRRPTFWKKCSCLH